MSYIEYDPHKPGDRERALREYFIGTIVLLGSIGSILYYASSLISLFEGVYTETFIYALCLLTIVAIIVFCTLFSNVRGKAKVEAAKRFFFFFVCGIVGLSALIGIFVAINSLYQNGDGKTLLLCSIVGFLLVVCIIVTSSRKKKGCSPISLKLFADRELISKINQTSSLESLSKTSIALQSDSNTGHIYCHKCGRKLPDNSAFCSSCGTKLK